uniref:Uncharacterized protein n=1 Tax=Rhizophagus irregularis (strain DAOM 181602 / DAOM 197198 / MUCL 43194) TaxID=747089 RepID=U9TAM5_RHIID
MPQPQHPSDSAMFHRFYISDKFAGEPNLIIEDGGKALKLFLKNLLKVKIKETTISGE